MKNNGISKKGAALLAATSALGGLLVGQTISVARAQSLSDLLLGGGILVLVDKFAPQIDRFVSTVTGNKTDSVREVTKVVPILSVGKGGYVGAVQVSGPRNQVDQVRAVAQVEGSTKIGREVRVRGLIPIGNREPKSLESLSRIKGVGVSALVDVRL